MGFRPLAIAVFAAACALFASSAQAQPIVSAMFDPFADSPPSAADVAAMKRAGVRVLRLIVNWPSVAPTTLPAQFDPADPADPAYRWSAVDAEVSGVVADGFQPIVDIIGAPAWAAKQPAESGSYDLGPDAPNARALEKFALAAARRYSGSYHGLPRVRYWQLYNEPNLDHYLRPQYTNNAPASPKLYRRMVNAFAASVHAVHADNLVIAGGLTPFTFVYSDGVHSVAPMQFMSELLCMSTGAHPHPTCKTKVSFDVWSHHPYTSGGPTHKAERAGDVSLGNLPEMKRLLDAAVRAGHIVSRKPPLFWVTEFSWDSSPPDPHGVPVKLLERWVPQAVYQMWRNGVSLVAWFTLRDIAPPSFYQSGLYFQDGAPKPYLEGYRFPLVAFQRGKGFYVWGRTPLGRPGRVVVEQRTGTSWHVVGTIRAGAGGIFQNTFTAPRTGWVRARLPGGELTLPFSLASVPDKYYPVFGGG